MESDEVERFKHCTVTLQLLIYLFFGNCTLLMTGLSNICVTVAHIEMDFIETGPW